MLFRIYDVIFAEGAAETLMRVALSLMRRNESRILACGELEDVMQLLLSRGLWDCYHYNADDFVQDFVSLSAVATREKLVQLEISYRDALVAGANANGASANAANVTTAASRFLGRIWTSSRSTSTSSTITSPKVVNLSPGLSAPHRPLSMLRRSASKQSLASTLNSMEASSVSAVSTASTEATSLSRDSSNSSPTRESVAVGGSKFHNARSTVAEDRYLHSQIEDLLTALSELQRNQALLEQQLQQERQEREEDKRAVQSLLEGLRKKASSDSVLTTASVETVVAPQPTSELTFIDAGIPNVGQTTNSQPAQAGKEEGTPSAEELSQLLDMVEQRFGMGDARPRSSMLLSKTQLKDDLAQAKEQLASAASQAQDYGRRIYDLDQEVSALKDQLRDSHAHVRNLHQDKQRLEKQIHGMRARASAASEGSDPSARETTTSDWASRMSSIGGITGVAPAAPSSGAGGLRELKLGRSKSSPSGPATSKRTSSLMRAPLGHESTIPTLTTAAFPPANEHEALLLELVQAKTAEAIAKQEAEEAKQKLESFRKAYGLAPGENPPTAAASAAAAAASTANAAASAAMGVLGRLTTSISESTAKPAAAAVTPAAAAPAASGGGFWGWRR